MNGRAISCKPPYNWMNLTRQGCGAMAAELRTLSPVFDGPDPALTRKGATDDSYG